MYGSAKYKTFYVDGDTPSLTNVTVTPNTSESNLTSNSTPTITWNATDTYFSKVTVSIDSGTAIHTYTTSGFGSYTVPEGKINTDGEHIIHVKAYDKAGHVTSKDISYWADVTKPVITGLTTNPQADNALAYATSKNPVISWDTNDTDIQNYKLNIDGTLYGNFGSNQKTASLPSDYFSESGIHNIELIATDKNGNTSSNTIKYYLDNIAPTGYIKVQRIDTDAELSVLSDTVSVCYGADDDHSGVKNYEISIYRVNADSSETFVTRYGKEDLANSNFSLNTTAHGFSNGNYRIKLFIEDEVGNTRNITKDVEILNRIPAPDISSTDTKTGVATVKCTIQKEGTASKLQYRLENDNNWTDAYSFIGSETEVNINVTLPSPEGKYKVYVRAVDKNGEYGKDAEVWCTKDTTSPLVELDEITKGYLTGTIRDDNSITWNVYIKKTTDADSSYELIASGEKAVENENITFIDLRDSKYIEGQEYTVKVEATDLAGNVSVETQPITKTAYVKYVEPGSITVNRPDYQKNNGENIIVFPENYTSCILEEDGIFSQVKWYVDNNYVSTDSGNNDLELSPYNDNECHRILALKENLSGNKIFSVDITKNAVIDNLSIDSIQANSHKDEQIELEGSKVIAFSLRDADPQPGVTYKVKCGNSAFVSVPADETVYICDLFDEIAYAEDLILRVTSESAVNIYNVKVVMDIIDSDSEEYFTISYAENYRPESISVEDKINYKTYVKWKDKTSSDTKLSYELYRSTNDDFDQSNTDVFEIRAGYFSEININYGRGFYYKVRAVIDNNGTKTYSSFSEVKYSQVVDANEYAKRMGIKEYWQYAEIDIPGGSLGVEKSLGNLVYEQTDASIPNEQLEVNLTRTYNSQSSAKSAFGVGWTHDYDIELLNLCRDEEISDNNMVLRDGSGTIYHFRKPVNGNDYVCSLGKFISLVKEEKQETVSIPTRNSENTTGADAMQQIKISSAYTVKTKDNLEYRFNVGGQLVYIQESNGNFLILEHDSEKGLLSKVITNRNLSIDFVYNSGKNGTDGLTVKEILLPDGSKVEYVYEGNSSSENVRLKQVIERGSGEEDPITYTYSYDNSQIPNINEFSDGNGKKYRVTYNDDDQVETVTYPDNEYIKLNYNHSTTEIPEINLSEQSSLEQMEFGTSTVTQRYVQNAVVSEETDYFNGFGNCIESVDPDGNIEKYTYLNHLLIKTESLGKNYVVNSEGYIEEKPYIKTETTEYSEDENETEIVEEDGSITSFEYDEDAPDTWDDEPVSEVETAIINGQEEEVIDVSYKYDDAGNETFEHDAVSNTTTITEYYNEDNGKGLKGEVKCEKEYLGNTSNEVNLQSKTTYTYSYDTSGNKTVTTTLNCGDQIIVTTVVYDVMGRQISNTDSRGKRTDYLYDGFGRLIKTTYTDGNIVTYTETRYDNNDNVVYTREENGIETCFVFDDLNREISRTITKGEFNKTWTTSYSYENVDINNGKGANKEAVSNAFVITETDPDGYVTAKNWQNHKDQIVRKLENGIYVDLTYDDQGNVFTQFEIGQEQTDGKGLLTMFIYDDAGNLTDTVRNPVYTEGGFYTAGEDTIVQSSEYDDSGNETASIDGEGYRTQYAYDVEGNVTHVTLPDESVTSAQYDVLNADGTTTDIITDALGRISKTVSDKGDLQTHVEDAGDGTVTPISMSYQYDANENVIRETDAEGNYITYLYDGKDRKTEAQHYDKSGNLTYITRYTYESDASDNLKVMADYTVADDTETLLRYTWYDYDELDRMTAMAELDGPAVPTESQITAAKITYSYDFDDNITSISYPDNGNGITSVSFEYNQFKWPIKVFTYIEGSQVLAREYSYYNDGKLQSVKDYRSILTGEAGYILKEYSYDSFERTNSIIIRDSSNLSKIKESYSYTYDKNNNILTEEIISDYPILEEEKTHELRSHTYDSVGRLISTVISHQDDEGADNVEYSYSYDCVGNRIRETEIGHDVVKDKVYTYNSLNQLVSSTETIDGIISSQKTYLYDDAGNQTLENDSVTSEIREQYYDVSGNMTRLVKKKGSTIELTQANQYNGNGQRISKAEADDVTRYFYQNGSVLFTTDEMDNLTSWNLLATSGATIGTTRGTGNTEEYYLYTKDIRGSTTSIVNDSGEGVVSYIYNDFGETEILGDKDFFNEICYTGGIYDSSTGIYYLNARYYDSASGVFLSQDSYKGELRNPVSLNLYGYCQGNPITYTDPSGYFPWAVIGAGFGAYDGYRYAKKKGYTGLRKAASIVGGAVLGAVNPFKIGKAVKTISRAKKTYKAVKSTKKIARAVNKAKSTKKLKKIFKKSNAKKISNKVTKKLTKKTTYKKKAYKPSPNIQKRKNAGCFVAGTKVSTAEGLVPIEKIKAGDRVWAEDTATGEKALKKVKKIFVREKDSLIRLSVNGEIIETTEEHPFWIKGQGWITAGNLKAGDIVKLQTGEYVPIESYEVILLKEPIKVYNFHVEDYECYYVSEQKVLVHNNCAMKAPKYNNKEISELAESLGYKKTGEKVKGQIVFKKGRKYIVQDIDSHNGGVWKMATSVKNLKSKSSRLGTYDKMLNRIGD